MWMYFQHAQLSKLFWTKKVHIWLHRNHLLSLPRGIRCYFSSIVTPFEFFFILFYLTQNNCSAIFFYLHEQGRQKFNFFHGLLERKMSKLDFWTVTFYIGASYPDRWLINLETQTSLRQLSTWLNQPLSHLHWILSQLVTSYHYLWLI